MSAGEISGLIGAGVALLAFLGGIFFQAFRLAIAPLRVALENNTNVMDRIVDKLECHSEKIGDHEGRIVRIETVHSYEE
jgi:hypothetical protein